MKRILIFVGTRPEAIKMAPVILALRAKTENFDVRVCASGQHRQLLDDALADFGIKPDFNLNVMTDGQTLASLSARLFSSIDDVLASQAPDAILVQGDTTTVMIAALAAFYRRISVGHVEAGLRSGDLRAPFPEELNRRVATLVTNWHFAPTTLARDNLVKEGVNPKSIYVTGNPVIDALFLTLSKVEQTERNLPEPLDEILQNGRRTILITAHRRENFGAPFRDVCDAISILAKRHADVNFVYPVHPNPNVQIMAHEMLGHQANIHLLEPLPYNIFVAVLRKSYLVLSDSGGVQEEAPSFGKPVLVMRDVTERPEGVDAGVNILVGTNKDKIITTVDELLATPEIYEAIARRANPFGDGQAGTKIAEILARDFA